MSNVLDFMASYWWIGAILLCVVFYKVILRVFFGLVIVPEDKIGLVTKKFVLFGEHKELTGDRIIAINGEAGFQGKTLSPGLKVFEENPTVETPETTSPISLLCKV